MELTEKTNMNVWEKDTWYITKDRSCLMLYKDSTSERIIGPGINSIP